MNSGPDPENGYEGAHHPTPRGRGRRWPLAVAGLVLLLGLAIGALFVRLLSGPLYTDLGTQRIATALAAAFGPEAQATVGVVGMRIAADFKPEIHLRDISVNVPGRASASIDTLAVTTSWATLLGRDTALKRVIVDHVFLETVENDAPIPAIPDLIATIDRGLGRTGLDYLDVDAITITRRSGETARRTVLEKAAVTAERAGERVEAVLVGEGLTGPWSVQASVGPGEGSSARLVDLQANGFDIADLGALAGETTPLAYGPATFTGRIGLTEGGAMVEGDGQLTVGPVEEGGEQAGVLLGRSRLEVRWRPEDRTLVIDPSPVVVPGGHGILTGTVGLPGGTGTSWPFKLKLIAHTGNTPTASGDLSGRYDPGAGELVVDQFTASGPGASFAAAMRFNHGRGHVAGALSGVFPTLSVDALKTLWPGAISPQARSWVTRHVSAGLIKDATVDLSVADDAVGGPGTAAALNFRFESLAFSPLDDGPPIINAFGTGTLVGNRLEITLDRGLVDLGQGRTLEAARGRFIIADIGPDPTIGEVELSLAGPAENAVALWERLPLSDDVDLPAASDAVSGSAEADIRLRLPLIKDIPASQVTFGGEVRFADLAIAEPMDGRTIRDGEITIALQGGMAAITGTASVDGVKAEIDIARPLKGNAGGSSAVRLVLGDDDRAKLGLDASGLLSGPVTVTVEDQKGTDGETLQQVTADLTKASISVPAIGFAKAKGKPGKATFTLRKTGSRTTVEAIVLEGGGARLEGSLALDGNGALVSAAFPRVRLSQSDRIAVKVTRADKGYKVAITGDRFDARTFIRQQWKKGDEGAEIGAPLELDIEVGSVTGWGEEALAGVNIAARVVDGRTRALSFTAQTAGGGSASATVTPAGGQRRVEIEAGEVGRLMRFLDLYPRIYGGRARVTGVIEPSGLFTATVDGSRWRIVEEPALARLSKAVTDGPAAGTTTADIKRLIFQIRFALGVLQIEDGIVRADTAGLSIQGDIDFRRDSLRLSGSYLPASALDSLLGKIPILGQTVFAGGRAGLFGVTFRLTGPVDDPTLSVNPLSVIAPGIFRKLFELG
ncbi:AsmA-like C-terminal region-containing protein [Chthonobacter albigriseus]|uniref:AsmA-like C-terminal region-containing protein n=1 Tax=Chthonobacter albigriseus TaxID=1683161 RepID=UPI0015EF54F1|nr:AsmA-like C-terminal region-containing protein [Chthonobacter albigriseus]